MLERSCLVLVALALAAGCGDGGNNTGQGGNGGSGGASGGSGGGAGLAIADLLAVETPSNVLAYDVSWSTSRDADTALGVDCGSGVTPWTISSAAPSSKHHIFLMGLVTGASCTLTAKAKAADGLTASASTTIKISDLPGFLPPIDLTHPATSGTIAPGWTLVNLSNQHTGVPYAAALIDSKGRFRWYYQYPGSVAGDDTPVSQYKDGVLIGGRGIPMSYVTWQGELVWSNTTAALFHHEATPAETPDEFYTLRDYQCSTLVNDDGQIVEYDSNKNQDVWTWSLCEHYTPPQDIPDWSHLNSVALLPGNKSLLVSSRNQNSLFKIDRTTGNLVWVMGFHGEVEDGFHGDFAIADADRFYHQHHATPLPNGHILMFDNGRSGVRDYSRALELAYTYNAGGASEAHAVWEYRHSPDIYATVWGSAQRLDNGNTLVCFGQREPGTQSTIVEVDANSKLLWEFTTPEYWGVYRAERIAEVYGSVLP